MNRLVLANFMRLKKNRMFWCGMLLTAAFSIFMCAAQFYSVASYGLSVCLDELLFSYMTLVGIVIAVMVSLFVGTEYHDGTLRNKIISGRSRRKIYLSNFVTCMAVGALFYFCYLAVTCLCGIPLFGPPRGTMENLFWAVLDGLLVCAAYGALFNLISMLSASRTNSAVICIILAFLLLFAAAYLATALAEPEIAQELVGSGGSDGMNWETRAMKNPRYLAGTAREIYQFFLDLLPSGQAVQLMDRNIAHPVRLPLYSLAVTAVCNMAGIFFFWRKDLR